MTAITLALHSVVDLTDEQFYQLCQANPDIKFERTAAYGEQRFITLGLLRGRVVVIAHTEVGDEVRVISMREGTKREQTIFFQSFSN